MRYRTVIGRFAAAVLLLSFIAALSLLTRTPRSATSPYVRAAPADVFLVDHDGDVGGEPCTAGVDNDCSLRSAIQLANSGAGPDTITFESGDMTITLGSPLPTLTDDHTTIGPLDTDQVIRIDANGAPGNVFEITGDHVTLSRLRMYGSGTGWANVWIHGAAQGVTIANNVIGDDSPAPGGCGDSSASHSGIFISSSGPTPSGARAWIYGNVIKCHGRFGDGDGHGIVVAGTDDVLIGEDASGPPSPDEQNDVVGNAGDGVRIWGEASRNVVRNSVIIDNRGNGVIVAEGASDNVIGANLESGNQISGNDGDGVVIRGTGTDRNLVVGNRIGTNATGDAAIPNGGSGVLIAAGASSNVIGSDSEAGRVNLISGNSLSGVRVVGNTTTDNTIDGNVIGLAWTRMSAVPNGADGVTLSGAKRTVVGSPGSETSQPIGSNGGAGVFDENTEGTYVGLSTHIGFNQEAGIAVVGSALGSNLVPGTIRDNGGLAIDLGNDGHTRNDTGDGDTGPNTLLNYPRITYSSGSAITGTACADCHVRVYEAIGDPARPGGGGTFVIPVSADATGSWSVSLPFGLTAADVSLVARDPAGNTSEMSPRPQILLPLVTRNGDD